MISYEGKRVLVVGMARSGIAAAKLLAGAGALPVLNDTKEEASFQGKLDELKGSCIFALGQNPVDLLETVDEVVISPAVPVTAPIVTEGRKTGKKVIGELELAYTLCRGEMCAVSGTNGKTTTVSLLGEIFANAGRTSRVVGNIGTPYSWAALEAKDDDVTTVEVSSFQLETIETFHPHVAALLNITEDHLNRHGTMKEYIRLKERLFENMTAQDVAVLNFDDPILREMGTRLSCPVAWFSRTQAVPQGAYVENGTIYFSMGGLRQTVCEPSNIFIPGPHNLENALAATAIAALMGVSVSVIAHTLHTFQGVEHRIETVRTLNGVTYINDSKGTNVDSTIKAVQTMTKPTAIILGGYDKHCDFAPLADVIAQCPMIKSCIVMGATAKQIEAALNDKGICAKHAQDLNQAILLGREDAKDGWNVLLSPACASFDMFSDYESRGRIFKELVNQLK